MEIDIHNIDSLEEFIDYFKKFPNVSVDTSDINNIKIFIRESTPQNFHITIG